MRRRVLASLVGVVLAGPLALAAACSGGGDVEVSVRGKFGVRPEVSFPKGAPSEELAVKTLVKGKGGGEGARKGDLVVADYVGYRWNKDGNKLLANSYISGQPGAFPTGRLVPGLDKALLGVRPGDRVVAKIPPEEGYGDKGDTQHQVGAGDSLVYVLDIRGVYGRTAHARGREQRLDDPKLPRVTPGAPGQAPKVSVPRAAAPKTLQVRTLIQGEGPPVAKGRLVALQYVGVFWRDGREFDSSWRSGRPYAVTIGTGQVIKGWDQALVGQKVGSRLLLVVPPSLGYGKQGLPQAGIKGDDTLVFVVDLLGVH
ncbi:peptidylprolyl isomerase [Actinomadura rubrobrunea]|uniref:Peptidyl-prolyl cis-trans isomerase n=1 Tax=Actinomadura rubrobrunea TaxID=115335 RepID=A0A9W6UXQ2_9ACTN|nr:FKBP-type peptidyl-prolyl cis-trans isomerase [Actinomadura rubrobrunea]GLW64940.1 peptidylprolyl isomerase [Actinomadura rubrobrunea]